MVVLLGIIGLVGCAVLFFLGLSAWYMPWALIIKLLMTGVTIVPAVLLGGLLIYELIDEIRYR